MRKSGRAPVDTVGAFLGRAEEKIAAADNAQLDQIIGQLRGFLLRPKLGGEARWQAARLLERAEREQLDRIFRP